LLYSKKSDVRLYEVRASVANAHAVEVMGHRVSHVTFCDRPAPVHAAAIPGMNTRLLPMRHRFAALPEKIAVSVVGYMPSILPAYSMD